MAHKLVINESAHRDAATAYDYYESRQAGLGERFLEALLVRYTDMTEHPQFYSYIAEDPSSDSQPLEQGTAFIFQEKLSIECGPELQWRLARFGLE